jgi:hypothetical protein
MSRLCSVSHQQSIDIEIQNGGGKMEKLNRLWIQYNTPKNAKVLYIVLALIALAIAAGAPGAGSGTPGGGPNILSIGFQLLPIF